MRIASATGAAVIASLLVVTPAKAFGGHTVVVAVHASGDLLDSVRSTAKSTTRNQRWTVVKPIERVNAAALVKCIARTNGKCVPRKFAKTIADSVLVITAKRSTDDDGQPRIIVSGRLFERKTGRFVNRDERYCVRCHDLARLKMLTTKIVTRLLRNRAVEIAPNTWLVVRTLPENAIVIVDSSRRGPSGQSLRVGAGPHDVRVEHAAYRTSSQTVVVKPNETKVLTVQLVPLGKPKKNQRKNQKKRRNGDKKSNSWKWAAGAGAGLLLGGVTLILAHTPQIKNNDQQPTRFESRGYGIGVTATGAALLLTSAILFYRNRRTKPSARRVSVGVSNGTVSIVFRSRF